MLPAKLLYLLMTTILGFFSIVEGQCKRGCDVALAAYYLSDGDNLTLISSLFNKDLFSDVLPYNTNHSQILNQDQFLSGIPIFIPFSCDCLPFPGPTSILAHTFPYVTQPGDRYDTIADSNFSHLTTEDFLSRVNSYHPNRIPDFVPINVTLNCSCGDPRVSMEYGLFATFPLLPGHTLSAVAAASGVPVELLRAYNPGVDFRSGKGVFFVPARDQNGTFPPLQLRKGKRVGLLIGLISSAVVAIMIFAFVLFFTLYKKKRTDTGKKFRTSEAVFEGDDVQESRHFASGRLVEFSYQELAGATSNFTSNKIGEGGFGLVYYAELRGEKAAIKRMKNQDLKGFLAELKILANVNHVNLVQLIGYCVEHGLFLVSEFVENGNLTQHLRDTGRKPLSWSTRVQIALDSARGLEYIHEHTFPAYIHRDVKSSNILIDKKFHGKVADFGLTKLAQAQSGTSHTSNAKGTLGYMPPEYVQYGVQSHKLDVYAFGVVLFELISAKEAIIISGGDSIEYKNLVSLFEDALTSPNSEQALRKLVDPRLGDDCPIDAIHKMALIGRTCTRDEPSNRPSMRSVVVAITMLSSATEDWNIGLFAEDETLRNLISGRGHKSRNMDQARILRNCLDEFCGMSGEKVNFSKSSMMVSRWVRPDVANMISSELDVPLVSDFGSYLGVPTIYGRRNSYKYHKILDKITARLSGWQRRTLSTAGRVTLAQSVLSSIPVYTMQTTLLPGNIIKDIDAKIRGFVWGSSEEQRKVHLIPWETVTRPRKEGGLGLRQMGASNTANLAKLGWRILEKPNDLWARVIRGKYCGHRTDVDMFRPLRNSSYMWKGIVSGSNLLARGTRMTIGDGSRTLFWSHNWIEDVCLADLSQVPIPEALLGATVQELWDGCNWKWDSITPYTSAVTRAKLINVVPRPLGTALDKPYWGLSPNGGFSTSSAYKALHPASTELQNVQWSLIWKLPVQQRVRHFIFLAVHERFMCNYERQRRHLSASTACPRCGGEETCIHALRDCFFARSVWRKSFSGVIPISFFQGTMKDWVFNNIKGRGQRSTCFGFTVWYIWKQRNALAFRGEVDDCEKLVRIANDAAVGFRSAMANQLLPPTPASSNPHGSDWAPPPDNWYKLNTDGASKGNPGVAGCGGVFLSQSGDFVRAFVCNLGICHANRAELFGVLHGLKEARSLCMNRLVMEVDASLVYNALQSELPISHPDLYLLQQCQELIELPDWEVRLSLVRRSANIVADSLANFSISCNFGLTTLWSLPSDISLLLLAEIVRPGNFTAP